MSGGTISGSTLYCGTISGSTLCGCYVGAGETLYNCGAICGGIIDGVAMSGGTISGSTLYCGTISGSTLCGCYVGAGETLYNFGTICGGTIYDSAMSYCTFDGLYWADPRGEYGRIPVIASGKYLVLSGIE